MSLRHIVTGRVLIVMLSLPCLAVIPNTLRAEYADVVLNRNSDAEGVRPVIFPHWFHRIRFQCRVCHQQLGFEMQAGANDISMEALIDGKYCGACHNGDVAWSMDNCDLCHSAAPGTAPGIQGGHRTLGPGEW